MLVVIVATFGGISFAFWRNIWRPSAVECGGGGVVGPMSSIPLWMSSIDIRRLGVDISLARHESHRCNYTRGTTLVKVSSYAGWLAGHAAWPGQAGGRGGFAWDDKRRPGVFQVRRQVRALRSWVASGFPHTRQRSTPLPSQSLRCAN